MSKKLRNIIKLKIKAAKNKTNKINYKMMSKNKMNKYSKIIKNSNKNKRKRMNNNNRNQRIIKMKKNQNPK